MLEKEHDLDQLKATKKTKSVVGELGPFGGIRPSISAIAEATNHNARLLEMALWEITSLKERIKTLEKEYK